MQQRLRRRQVQKRTGRKDSEARRIGELFNSAAREKDRSNPLADFFGSEVPKGNSFDNPAAWDTFARGALRLEGTDLFTRAMRGAFESFKLDPVDPYSWRILVSNFAFIFFGEYPNKKRGQPKMPTEQLISLLEKFEQLKTKTPKISERESARLLANNMRVGQEALRKQLRRARRAK